MVMCDDEVLCSEEQATRRCCTLEELVQEVLCAERVTQMTKAYNDIEAVTSLLEEKERDLELAARIGQSLLERNKELEEKNSEYEVQLVEANDKIKQLRHEVSQKEALLQMYLHEEELSSDTPEDERLQLSVGVANIVGLQKKVQSLEAENFKLIKQTASLKTETALQEEKEQSLFRDCVRQLEDYKNQVIQLQDELLTKSDTNLRQQEEITSLTEKKVALEAQNRKLLEDLEELKKSLTAAHVVQQELTSEIAELEKKNEELEVLLCEKQEEIKSLRKKQKPAYIRHHSNYNSPFLPEDSLALELQDCFRRGFDYIPGYSTEERREHNRRAFRTARAVRQASRNSRSSANSSYGNESESTVGSPLPTSHCPSECELSDGGYGADIDSVLSSNLGKPPLSGASDLDFALSRLATTKSDKQNNNDLSRCHTPDSMMSVSSFGNLSEVSRLSGRLPEKLQLVKPLEGSQTLHHWKRLATPHLAGILEHRPGIQNKGENIVESEYEETYSLSDYEEDDDYSLQLGKCMEQTSGIYTFTMSKVLHPNDEFTSYTNRLDDSHCPDISDSSYSSGSVPTSSVSYSKFSDCGTSTFSMSAGLARKLQERGCHTEQQSNIKLTNIQRYDNLVTETISGAVHSQSEAVYSVAGSTASTSDVNTLTSAALWNMNQNAYLVLADKVKEVGLNTVLTIVKKSGIAPVMLDPVDTGLNAIMSIKRNRGALNRGMAQKLPRRLHTDTLPRINVLQTKPLTYCPKLDQKCLLPAIDESLFNPETSSTPKSDSSHKDVHQLRSFPSLVATPRGNSTPAKRPDSLKLSSTVNDVLESSVDKQLEQCKMEHKNEAVQAAITGDVPAVSVTTVAGQWLSSGLLRHLSNFYSKSRDVVGGHMAENGDN